MTQRLRTHLSHHIVAYVALFVALGGTSYGLASGSVDSREIKNDTVRTRDLRNNDVRSRDIRNRTILGRDVLTNAFDGDQIDEKNLGEVPSATAADTAAAIGGVPAGQVGRAPAAAITFEDGEAGDVLTLPGLGVVRVPAASPCDTTNEDIGVEVFNSSGDDLEVFSAPPVDFDTFGPGDESDLFLLTGPPAHLQLRVIPRGPSATAATVDVFYAAAGLGTECRLSAQAIISG